MPGRKTRQGESEKNRIDWRKRYQHLEDNIPGMVFSMVYQTNRPCSFLYVSKDALELIGVAPAELLADAGIANTPELPCHAQLAAQLDGFPEVHWAAVPFAPLVQEGDGPPTLYHPGSDGRLRAVQEHLRHADSQTTTIFSHRHVFFHTSTMEVLP